MYVREDPSIVWFIVDETAPEAPLKEDPGMFMARVEVHGVGRCDFLEVLRDAVRCFLLKD